MDLAERLKEEGMDPTDASEKVRVGDMAEMLEVDTPEIVDGKKTLFDIHKQQDLLREFDKELEQPSQKPPLSAEVGTGEVFPELGRLRERAQSFYGSTRLFLDQLLARRDEGLNTLMEDHDARLMWQYMTEISNIDFSQQGTLKKLEEILNGMTRSVDAIGRSWRYGKVKDSPESLQRVAFLLRRMSDESNNLSQSFRNMQNQEVEMIFAASARLREKLENSAIKLVSFGKHILNELVPNSINSNDAGMVLLVLLHVESILDSGRMFVDWSDTKIRHEVSKGLDEVRRGIVELMKQLGEAEVRKLLFSAGENFKLGFVNAAFSEEV
jgi:hypothetical protein